MKKDTDKQPIDDLFARKLGKMSLAPRPDSFERLQKRMNPGKPEVRMVIWHNQTRQRYMAAAACLGLLCLFGWLYWHSDTQTASGRVQVATTNTLPEHPRNITENQSDRPNSAISSEQKDNSQLAFSEETATSRKKRLAKSQVDEARKPVRQPQASLTRQGGPVVAEVKPAKAKIEPEDTRVQATSPADHLTTEQVAGNAAIVKSGAERVLIVTIEEPASLVVARQKARDFVEEKAALATSDKADKEARGNVWQQVKRFKEGELFARHNEESTDERGLLDRAYSGLKHSFDKHKPTKQ